MARIQWDQIGKKTYETGVDHGVLYLQKDGAYPKGVAWNGLTSISESPSGAEDNALYADNIKYLSLKSAEEFGVTIECYSYPDEWKLCDGTAELLPGVSLGQQKRCAFGLAYRTKIGNDQEFDDHGYKLHLVYGCSSATSERSYGTINDSPEAITFSYEVSTTPVQLSGKDADGKPFKPVSLVTIDSTVIDPEKLAKLEDILYGVDADPSDASSTGTDGRLPLPDELATILAAG